MVRNGRLLTSPPSSWRSGAPIKAMLGEKVREHGVSHGLTEVGYDVRIKQAVSFFPSGVKGAPLSVSDGQPQTGRFCIASTVEEFEMPTDLVAIVHDKSTWARKGLSVFNTVIEPGWRGFLTLELVYHGQGELHIPAGSGVAQVIFHEVMCRKAYEGKYQDQPDQPVEAQFRD